MTEQQIAEGCKTKNPFAQRLLYDRYVDTMFILCVRYIVNRHDAEEVLSNAFLKCFENIGKFEWKGNGSIRAWLSRIVVNECLMFLRKRRGLYIPVDDTKLSEQAIDDDNVLEQMHVKELMQQLLNMPDGYRTVLNLFVFEDMSHKDIAVALNISENTSKSQLHKARTMLRQKLQKHLV